ncbi:MAG: hypothetical protein ACOZNI_06700, partial [Myxococcota bacterium]
MPPLVQNLPSEVPEVRRMLVRDAAGEPVEVVEGVDAEAVPKGGVFADFEVEDGRLVLGAPLVRGLDGAEPIVVLALAERVLRDLETLHGHGGAHGALAAEGWGFDGDGVFRVRPAFHLAPPPGDPRVADVVAVGRCV